MSFKQIDAGRSPGDKRHSGIHLHSLIREASNLDDLDHDLHTEISDSEAAERTSRYIISEMQKRFVVMR